MKTGDTAQIMDNTCFNGFSGIISDISPCGGFCIESGTAVLVVPMYKRGRRLRKTILLNGIITKIKGN